MKYETKFDINQTVCFKDSDDGVKRGRIVGTNIQHAWHGIKVPDEYQQASMISKDPVVTYVILIEKHEKARSRDAVTPVGQDRIADTFEAAWKLP